MSFLKKAGASTKSKLFTGGRKVYVQSEGVDLPDAPDWIRYKQELEILHLLEDRIAALKTVRAFHSMRENWIKLKEYYTVKKQTVTKEDMAFAKGSVAGGLHILDKCIGDISLVLAHADWSKHGPSWYDAD